MCSIGMHGKSSAPTPMIIFMATALTLISFLECLKLASGSMLLTDLLGGRADLTCEDTRVHLK